MSTAQTLILGAVAGLTIFVGLPMGRIRSASPALRAAMSSIATGILVFLFWDVVSHGVDPVEARLQAHRWGSFAWYATLLGAGFALGLMCARLLRRLAEREARDAARRPRRRRRRRVRAPQLVRVAHARPPARAADRDGHRPAQLRRGPRDRPVGRRGRVVAGARADHRLRPPQHDRGLRHRRPDVAARPRCRAGASSARWA